MKTDKENKFIFKDNRPFKEKTLDFLQSLMFWKGRKKGMIFTKNISLDELRAVFFPKNFYEKYHYLGSVPYRQDGKLFKALYPLVLAMDYEAKPKWCPRWVLRFLHLFGSDNSIVRVRNFTLHNWEKKLTKGMMMWDYKTKWTDYDLRISINAPQHLQDLANYIETGYFSKGRQEELVGKIKAIDPEAKIVWGSVDRLVEQYNKLNGKKTKTIMTISVEILIAIFFVLLTPIVISLMWVKGIDYMQKNYPDYKGYDLFDEPFDNPMIKEPSVSPQNASEMMITTNEDIINSIPTDDDFSDWDVTLMDGLEDEKDDIKN